MLNAEQEREHADSSTTEAQGKRAGSWMIKELLDWGKTIVVAIVIVIVTHLFVFNLSTVAGHSMEPTLEDGEWLYVNKFVYLMDSPKLEDVIILKSPNNSGLEQKYLVKRIVGLPGDRIEIRDHELYRNGELVEESYIDTRIEDSDYGPIIVQNGHYFVLGDNRHARASMDSRSFSAISDELIEGRADYILWPLDKMRSLK